MYLFANRSEKDQIIKTPLVISFSYKGCQLHIFHIHSNLYRSSDKAIPMADLDDDDIPNLTESSGDEDSEAGEYPYNCSEKYFVLVIIY